MNDELKHAWQSQAHSQRVTLDAALVLDEVRRNEQRFTATIFWRNVREVSVALLLVPIWIYLGILQDALWTWYLVVPTMVWIAGFITIDRLRQRQRQPAAGDALCSHLEHSLDAMKHQIWLLQKRLLVVLAAARCRADDFPCTPCLAWAGDIWEAVADILFSWRWARLSTG
jgi:hypothetical protein